MIHELTPLKYYTTYGPNEPAIRIKSGDTVITSTVDAGGNDHTGKSITDEMRHQKPGTTYSRSNPLTGPIFIEDAEIGDTLSIKIEDITLNRSTAYSMIPSNFGCLTEEAPGRRLLLNKPLDTVYYEWVIDLKNHRASLEIPESKIKKVTIDIHPFIGSIGVAPRYGRVEMSLTPGEFGGNMDCVETKQGSTLYLPVFVDGGYLVLGDVHAAQGDGELCGVALETSANIRLKIDVIKNKPIEWPRIEDSEWIMTACSSRPLMEAYKIAHYEMVNWLQSDYGFTKLDAIQLLSQVGRCRIGNVVDPNYTVVSKYPKIHLP